MPKTALLIAVRLLAGRYHGAVDWPPSPYRVFQALIAGAYGGRWRNENPDEKDRAFYWLERCEPPWVSTPPGTALRGFTTYVPNNDVDATLQPALTSLSLRRESNDRFWDPAEAGRRVLSLAVGGRKKTDRSPEIKGIRSDKTIRARVFSSEHAFLYAWPFEEGDVEPACIAECALRLHTLGHGVDAAAAEAEVTDWSEAERRLVAAGHVARPALSGDGLRVPIPGSLDSLHAYYAAFCRRLVPQAQGRTLFRQPGTKPLFRTVAYDRPPSRLLFELRAPQQPGRPFRPIPQEHAAALAAAVRDGAAARLASAMPDRAGEIERLVIGRGASAADLPRRVRFIPLPTIGFVHAAPSIRRVLVEVPPDCPLPPRDIAWALSGLALPENLPWSRPVLDRSNDDRMLLHYGIGTKCARRWRSVTPLALPVARAPGRLGGTARAAHEARLAGAARTALRQAGCAAIPVAIRTQREPLHGKGARAEAFATERFDVARLRHAEVTFATPVAGPLVLGDGRFLGLGIMQPVNESPDAHWLTIEGNRPPVAAAERVAAALRRAIMARVGAGHPKGADLPTFFTGHDKGGPSRPGHHAHLFFLAIDRDGDGEIDEVAVLGPHCIDPRAVRNESELAHLDAALTGFERLTVSGFGAFRLRATAEPIPAAGTLWRSHTRYRSTRHVRPNQPDEAALTADLALECTRRNLPVPAVSWQCVEREGTRLCGHAQLAFPRPMTAPLLLGRNCHLGAGLFVQPLDGG